MGRDDMTVQAVDRRGAWNGQRRPSFHNVNGSHMSRSGGDEGG